MSWEIVLDERWPVSVLERLSAVVSDFPGDEQLMLRIGERELCVQVSDTPGLRERITKVIKEESGCEL